MIRHLQYFEILGLDEPPVDRKTVKRAYSKMLKLTRPEDDPEGFMRLRDAHDQALNILQWQSEERDWAAQQAEIEGAAPPDAQIVEGTSEQETSQKLGLTYEDMLPEPEAEIDTSYSLGPTPHFDAPVTFNAFSEPAAKPIIENLENLLLDPKKYNNREQWNEVFRDARQLDIDDYVDFENALLDSILRFHGFFDYHPDHDTPQKMPMKLSPSIAASLFKTMSWDQVNTRGRHRTEQVDWLERRMNLRRRGTDPVPVPQNNTGGNGNVWVWLIGAFVVLKIIQALANI